MVSNTRQANQILQEVQSVRMIVGASLRARHRYKDFSANRAANPSHKREGLEGVAHTVKHDGSETKLDRLAAYCITPPPHRKGRPVVLDEKTKAPTHLFDERGPRQDILDLDAGMNGKRRTATRKCLIDGFHGIATIIIDTRDSGLDAAIAQHTAFGKGICDGALR
jgi:hypothetical protein